MFLMAGLLVIGLLCNLAVRPVAACRFRHGATPAAGATEKSPVAFSKMRLASSWLVVCIPLGGGIWLVHWSGSIFS